MKKNVMFLIGDMNNGGAERVVKNLCDNLKDDYNVTLVVRTMENADYIPNVTTIEIPKLGFFPKMPLSLYRLRKLKKKLRIDVSISFLTTNNIHNCFSRYKEKDIVSVRNVISQNLQDKKKKDFFLYKYAIKKADLIVNVSEAAKEDTINSFKAKKEKNIVIPNFCDIENIDTLKKVKLDKDLKKIFDGQVAISIGRYHMQKGHWHLIRAFKKVVDHNNKAKLVLVGRGKYKDYYLRLIKDLKLENHVFVLDFTENVYSYLYNSDIHVLTSFHEGMPNVVLEAMACGIPNIATDAPGGSKEILDPKNTNKPQVKELTLGEYGILIPVCDRNEYNAKDPLTFEEEKIAEAINMLFDNPELYAKYKKASELRIKDFNKESILTKWKNVIEDIK